MENPKGVTLEGGYSLLAAHQEEVLASIFETIRPFPVQASIWQIFTEQAFANPSAIATCFGSEKVSYGQLWARSRAYSEDLIKAGVVRGNIVGLTTDRSVELVVAILGILRCGAAYLPVDGQMPPDRLAFILKDAGVSLLITSSNKLSIVGSIRCFPLPGVGSVQFDAVDPLESRPPSSGSDLAYVLYTSGSTGLPKGVMVENRSVLRLVLANDYARFSADRVFLHLAPVAFDASIFEIFGALLNGARLVIYPSLILDLETLGQILEEEQVTTLWLTAALFNTVVDSNPQVLRPVEELLIGGEVLSPAHVKRAYDALADIQIINGYGPTETTTFACTYAIPRNDSGWRDRVPIGRPISNTFALVMDAKGNPLPAGQPGELWIGGDGVARGYLNHPELTAQRFPTVDLGRGPERVYRSGDSCVQDANGLIHFLGRDDGQVKLHGFRIELLEIETVLRQKLGSGNCAVILREDQTGDRYLAAYVTGKPDLDSVRRALSASLPAYMIPRTWSLIESIPVNANGKVDRRAFPEPVEEKRSVRDVVESDSPEQKVVAVWKRVLGREQIDLNTGFVTLGGSSLVAIRLVSALARELGYRFSVQHLLADCSISQLVLLGRDEGSGNEELSRNPRSTGAIRALDQAGLWAAAQAAPQALYNVPIDLRLSGPIDSSVLKKSLEALITRHQIFRSCYAQKGGSVWIQMESVAPLDWAEKACGEGELEGEIEAASREGFDLEEGSLLRARWYPAGDGRGVLLLVFHHIICDEWSIRVLLEELSHLYAAGGDPVQAGLERLEVDYADYAAWRNERIRSEAVQRSIDYWREQLRGVPGLLDLPLDRVRPEQGSHRGATVRFEMEEEVVRGLRAVARAERATMFMVMLAAWKVLLFRYSHQEEIVVGTPVTLRSRPELERMVGYFLNMLPIRSKVRGEQPFTELLKAVKETVLQGLAHRDVPFGDMVQLSGVERSTRHTPLFQVSFVYVTESLNQLRIPGVEITGRELETGTAKFDLTIFMEEQGDRLHCGIEYASDLFDPERIQRMAAHWRELSSQITVNPKQQIERLEILPASEHQLLNLWNETSRAYPGEKCIHQLFEEQARLWPDATALVFGDVEVRYGELNERANRLAGFLKERAVRPDSPVALIVERSVEMIFGLLAILKAGGAYLPIAPDTPTARVATILNDAGVTVLLTQNKFPHLVKLESLEIIFLDLPIPPWRDAPAKNPACPVTSRNLAYVIYTSGSTGQPKGVMVEHRSVARLVFGNDYVAFGPDRVFLQMAPLAFDASTFEIWGALLHGAKLVIYPPKDFNVELFGSLVRDRGITSLFITTALFNHIVDTRPEALRYQGELLFGGERVSPNHVVRAYAAAPSLRLVHCYGPTEATTFASTYPIPPDFEAGPYGVPVGGPLGNTTAQILDAKQRRVPIGVAGELWLGGVGVARGYLGDSQLTADRFRLIRVGGHEERMYRSGDICRFQSSGDIDFIGRTDDQIKLRGYRIELGEVEKVLNSLIPGGTCAVTLVKAPQGDILAAFIAGDVSLNTLKETASSQLPPYMIPALWISIEALPLNANGKVDRRKLARQAEVPRESVENKAQPTNECEHQLAEIWCSVLQRDRIGVDDNFFEMGGHSLLAVDLCLRVQQRTGFLLEVQDLMRRPTIRSLARIMAARDPAELSDQVTGEL